MPKMKTKKAIKKRIKITGSGKIMCGTAGVSHLAQNKTTKQKRQARGWGLVDATDCRRWKKIKIS